MHQANQAAEAAHQNPREKQSALKSLAGWGAFTLAVPLAAFEAIVVHSLLGGKPAIGAIQGLLATGALAALLVFAVLPRENRPRFLSRLVLFASVVAVGSAVVLTNKLAHTEHAATSAGVQTILLLVFQATWAVTWWLAAARGHTSLYRYIPAALGAVVLAVGGFMMGGAEVAEPGAEPQVATFAKFVKPADLDSAREVARAGSTRGSDFVHYHTGQRPLLGISFSTTDWMRRERIGSDLRGIFDRDAPAEGAHVLLARPGYAIVMLEVQAEDHVNAIRAEFGRIDGSLISYEDRYRSDWVGGYRPGDDSTRLDANDDIVIGLSGTRSMVLNSLGVLVGD